MKEQNLEQLRACKEARVYRKQFKTFKEAWDNCPRGDWMLWIASRAKVDKRKLTLAKGKCAELVIHLMKDQRSIDAVKAAINYGEGNIDEVELAAADAADAADAAAAAADAADAAAAADAADAAAAAYAAAAYAATADATAYAAAADAAADAADADADAREQLLLKCADICREILTDELL